MASLTLKRKNKETTLIILDSKKHNAVPLIEIKPFEHIKLVNNVDIVFTPSDGSFTFDTMKQAFKLADSIFLGFLVVE